MIARATEFPGPAIAAVSVAMLAFAYISEHGFGYPPCELCWYQRYAHFAIVVLGMLAWRCRIPILTIPFLLSIMASIAIAGFHAGVEQKWWDGPSTCSSALELGTSLEEALEILKDVAVIRCDDIAWSFAGLSMAAWNFLISLSMLGLVIYLIRRQRA